MFFKHFGKLHLRPQSHCTIHSLSLSRTRTQHPVKSYFLHTTCLLTECWSMLHFFSIMLKFVLAERSGEKYEFRVKTLSYIQKNEATMGLCCFLLCFQWRNTSSVYKIALEKYKEYRYYKTKQTPVMRHYVHHAKATVWSPGYEN